MNMENAEEILVIILAGVLILFLLLAIVAIIKFIQVLNHLKSISEKAEHLANRAENISQFFKYSAGPAALGNIVANITEAFTHRKKKGKD